MAFPLIAAIGGLVKGAGSLIKKIKVNGDKKVAAYNTAIMNGESPQAKKGFLGMFTGKKKIQKAQAQAFEQMKAAEQEKQQQVGEGAMNVLPWVAGVLAFLGLLFVMGGRKR